MPLFPEPNPRTPSLIKEYRARHGPSPGSLRDCFIVGSSLKRSRGPMRTSSGATSSPLWAQTSRAPRWPRASASRTTTSEFWARGIPDGFPAEPPMRTKTVAAETPDVYFKPIYFNLVLPPPPSWAVLLTPGKMSGSES